ASLKGARLRNSERYSCETMSTIPHTKLTDPIPLVKLDFQEIEYLYSNLGNWIDPPVELRATRAGIAQFLVYWWEIVLDTEGHCRINTAPEGGCESWEQAVRPLAGWDSDECLRIRDGDLLHLHLRMQADGIDVLLQDATNSQDPVTEDAVPDDDLVELLLEEEELMRLNDSGHWQAVKEAMTRALSSLAPGSFVQLLDISDALPLSLLLAPELCAAASRWDAVCCLRSRAEKQALLSLMAESSLDTDRVHILLASAQQLIQAALPSPFPPNGAGAEATLQSTPSASLIICEDIVGASGALRAEALEDLSLLWRTCSGRHGRELRVVPEAIVLKLSLIESDELERRTRVVERPGGVDVSEVNALSVSDFLSLEESLLKPRCLCKEVEALSLPLGPSLLTALAALSARENGAPLLRLRLTAESSGKVHGIVTRFAWPGSAGQSWDKRLAGVVWPCEGRNRPPHLEVGDSVVVTVGYTPARGLVVTPVCLERGVPAAPRENKKCLFAGRQVGCKASDGVGMWAAISAQQLRGQVSPFGPYGGLAPAEERTTEHPERLASLNAGVADFEYEQFLKAKEVQRAMFKAENKTIVHQNADTDVIQASEGSIACIDGNQAAAHVAYALSDCAFIYPITPSSPMGEMVDEWAAQGLINCYGQKLSVTEMQSEAGAAGALHGALKAGALSTTFTASQGLLLMIPNMFKIAGELLPCVMHVAARALAGQALSIFGDHSDVMACRSTGWAMLASESVEMVQYNALVAHLVSMERRVPVQHFFDGFRTSHEVNKVKLVDYKTMKDFVNWDAIKEHHDLAMNPRHPHVQGTSQGPDIFFQCVEAGNTFYDNLADLFEAKSRLVEQKTGVHYALYAYEGHPEATNVIVVMGSGAVTCSETAKYLHDKGEKVGVLKVRLFRPWDTSRFLGALPKTTARICVLDRTKEPGSQGEPLFLEVSSTLQLSGRADIICIGGRYGLGSKEFTPNMVLSIYENLAKETPKPRFTVGINDDVTNLSLPVGDWLDVLPQGTTECMFYGLGSDGTVGANKSAVKMIALGTELYAQAYFEYDAKKSGGVTISHLRFGPKPIHAPYNVRSANYLAVHKSSYVTNYDMTRYLKPNGVCVINCSWTPAELEKHLPAKMRRDLATKQAKLYWAKLYIIDATQIAVKAGLGKRINMIMQSVFFKLSGVMPYEEAIEMLKKSIKKMYGKKGDAVVKMNIDGVDASVTGIVECPVPSSWASLTVEEQSDESSTLKKGPRTIVDMTSDQFAKQVQSQCNNLDGNALPVSTFVPGGRVPLGTSQYEKRGIAINVPTVDMDKCTQCNKCSLICPHAAVRPFLATTQELSKAPQDFRAGSRAAIGGGVLDNYQYRIQVSPWDCTGCELCVRICPADALKLSPAGQVIQQEEPNWNFAVTLPDRGDEIDKTTVKGSQFQKPYLEFSGACEGCGETPHVKLMTQLFGERLVIANATGCSSIWGGSNPSFPYTVNSKGEGPAWANSLFEDNAEFGFGMRKAFKQRRDYLAMQVEDALGDKTVIMSDELRQTLQQYLVMRKEQMHDLLLPRGRSIYHQLMEKLEPLLSKEKDSHPKLKYLHDLEDMFGRSSFWMVGGDGWAYDIGYGGLDHVIASEEHVNILVLDTEMYSNTGGQASKSTPKGAMAKFAEGGKLTAKKDMGQLAMTYKNVYVASICVHVNPQQAVRAMLEADAYAGPSIILAYSPCISQGFPMAESIQHCQMAVDSGYWPLYRYNPEAAAHGNNPFQLDSKKIKGDLFKFLAKENRFAAVMRRDPKHAQELDDKLKEQLVQKNHLLQVLNKDDLEGQFHKLVEGLSDASSAGNSVTILYGSETGNSEEQAKNLMQDIMARGLKATCTAMDDFDFEELPNQKIVILVVSTCGLGEYPANCKQTWMKLQSQELPMSWLSGTKFAVFGLGDSTYSQFCVAAIGFDTRLGELGAQRMLKRGVGDDRDEDRYYTGWEAWLPELWQVLGVPQLPLSQEVPTPCYRVDVSAGSVEKPPVKDDDIVPPGATKLTLLHNSVLTGDAKYDRDIRHYEFKIEGTSVSYKTGESLAIWPRNPIDKVLQFCTDMGLDAGQQLRVLPLEGARNWCPMDLNVRQLFSHVLDIFGKPNRKFFETLSLFAKDEKERSQLRSIVENSAEGQALYRDLTHDFAHHADVLRKFQSARPPIEQLLNMIPVLKPRSYSIASSPLMHPDKIQLCVVLVDWKVESTQELRIGECTGYMRDQQPGASIMCAVRSSAIVLPKEPSSPVLMAGMGTGLAPWRAVTQERICQHRQGQKVGPCMLFFGARYAVEYLYKDEFESYVKEGVLSMHTAFSREQARKIYVQHRIMEAGEKVAEYMLRQNGHFYVCGSARQVPEDIYTAMKEVMMANERVGEEDAEAILSNLKMEGRYTVEAWS
ncbi:PFOR, partial [Symbiodinium necroappetens]